MRKYVLTSKRFEGSLIFEYDAEGILVCFKREAELDIEQMQYLQRNFPFVDTQLQYVVGKGEITEVTDLSFGRFWNDYAYKVGNKNKAEKLWLQLSESEKLAVLDSLKRYNYYLKIRNIAKVYPERYLLHRRWENDFKVK